MSMNINKQQWVELFRETGLVEEMMEAWHRLFEANYPDGHQGFLEWLQLTASEIAAIRQRFS